MVETFYSLKLSEPESRPNNPAKSEMFWQRRISIFFTISFCISYREPESHLAVAMTRVLLIIVNYGSFFVNFPSITSNKIIDLQSVGYVK